MTIDGRAVRGRKKQSGGSHSFAELVAMWGASEAQWLADNAGKTADDFHRVNTCSASPAEQEAIGKHWAKFDEETPIASYAKTGTKVAKRQRSNGAGKRSHGAGPRR